MFLFFFISLWLVTLAFTGRLVAGGRTKLALELGVIVLGCARYACQPVSQAAAWLDLAWTACFFMYAIVVAGLWREREVARAPRSGVVWARLKGSDILLLLASMILAVGSIRVYDLVDRPAGAPCGKNIGVCLALRSGTSKIFVSDPGGAATLDMCRAMEFRGCFGNQPIYLLVWVAGSVFCVYGLVRRIITARPPRL